MFVVLSKPGVSSSRFFGWMAHVCCLNIVQPCLIHDSVDEILLCPTLLVFPSGRRLVQKLNIQLNHAEPNALHIIDSFKLQTHVQWRLATVRWAYLMDQRPAGRPSLRLPPHVSEARVLSDLDYLVTTLNVGLLSPEDQDWATLTWYLQGYSRTRHI